MSTSTHAADSLSTWSIDPVHTSVHFKVRHMMISNVRGEFKSVKGTLHFDKDDISRSSVEAEIDASSIHTREEQRDAHLKSADFLDTEKYPAIQFRSTSIRPLHADAVHVEGDLTIHGVARQVAFDAAGPSAVTKDPWGNLRIAASASLTIRRSDFGLTWNAALEAGGVLVGDNIEIDLDVEFVKAS